MAVQVEHEKRKKEILEKALNLFIEEGYEDVTYQKIADRCGITRTTLYIYFKNKREIFLWSIKQLTGNLEKKLIEIVKDESMNSCESLLKIIETIVCEAEENIALFQVILTYLMQLKKSGIDANERVLRRVIRLQHLMSTVIIRGQKKGEIKNLPVKEMNDLIYSLMECGIFRIAVLGSKKLDGIREMAKFVIDQVKV